MHPRRRVSVGWFKVEGVSERAEELMQLAVAWVSWPRSANGTYPMTLAARVVNCHSPNVRAHGNRPHLPRRVRV